MTVKRMVHGNVLIEKIEEEQLIKIFKRKSIINRKVAYGKVVKTSPGRLMKSGELMKTELSEGDIVVFEEGGHESYFQDNVNMMIVPEAYVLAKIEKENKDD